ncbi:DUF6612 family protein [Saccharibacillus alkalitolerans]|uniref:Lipoprotein n=1 Tax=Saccharibacillus alkalitolerans TaxID=2705290 RepID=A0ABX0FCG7_9BACL|nr:DUF6612 family protein [Saccharibacillus alkalitolerans]NGZ78013.1 hypothetical protein [Saccharibacillus alkalitolerans]
MYSAKGNRNRHYLINTLKMSALSLLLLSAACTSDSGTQETGKDAKPSGETTQSAASVYDTALEQAKALESYNIESKTNYTVEQPAAEEGAKAPDPVQTAIDISGGVIAKPEVQYGLKIDTLAQGQQGSIEIYAAGDELYTKDASGVWTTQSLANADESPAIETDMLDPAPLLEKLSAYKDSLKLAEDDNGYTLTFEASGEQAAALIEDALTRQLGDSAQSAQLSSLVKTGSEGKVNYSLVIDKKTHQLTSSSMKLDTTLDVNEQQIHITGSSDDVYSEQNAVSEIAVPAEATADASAKSEDAAESTAGTSGK